MRVPDGDEVDDGVCGALGVALALAVRVTDADPVALGVVDPLGVAV